MLERGSGAEVGGGGRRCGNIGGGQREAGEGGRGWWRPREKLVQPREGRRNEERYEDFGVYIRWHW